MCWSACEPGSGVPQAAWRPVADAAGLSPDPAPSARVKWVICELVDAEILNIIRIVCALLTQSRVGLC